MIHLDDLVTKPSEDLVNTFCIICFLYAPLSTVAWSMFIVANFCAREQAGHCYIERTSTSLTPHSAIFKFILEGREEHNTGLLVGQIH